MTLDKRHRRIVCAALMFLLSLASAAVWSQSSTPAAAPLPPAAQEAIDNGIIAAKVPDYLLALRYFEAARKLAPNAAVVYLNLGLAESKIAGRELRAMAWFGAYLAAAPAAPNAAAVKEQLQVLYVKSQSNLSRLLAAVQDAAEQVPTDIEPTSMARDQGVIFNDVLSLWAKIGDIERAQKLAERIRSDNWKSYAYTEIAGAHFVAGHFAEATRTAGRIPDAKQRSEIQQAISEAAAKPKSASHTAVDVSDWLKVLGLSNQPVYMLLNTALFLDLGGHLKSLPPPSKGINQHYYALLETAKKIVNAHNEVDKLRRQQAGK